MTGIREKLMKESREFLRPSGAFNNPPTVVVDPNKIAGDLSRKTTKVGGPQQQDVPPEKKNGEFISQYQRIAQRMKTGIEHGTIPRSDKHRRKLQVLTQHAMNQQKDRMLVSRQQDSRHSTEEQNKIPSTSSDTAARKRKNKDRSNSGSESRAKKPRLDDQPSHSSKQLPQNEEVEQLKITVERLYSTVNLLVKQINTTPQMEKPKQSEHCEKKKKEPRLERNSISDSEDEGHSSKQRRLPKPSPEKKKSEKKLKEKIQKKRRRLLDSEGDSTEFEEALDDEEYHTSRQKRQPKPNPEEKKRKESLQKLKEKRQKKRSSLSDSEGNSTEFEEAPTDEESPEGHSSKQRRLPKPSPDKKKRQDSLQKLKEERRKKRNSLSDSEGNSTEFEEAPTDEESPEGHSSNQRRPPKPSTEKKKRQDSLQKLKEEPRKKRRCDSVSESDWMELEMENHTSRHKRQPKPNPEKKKREESLQKLKEKRQKKRSSLSDSEGNSTEFEKAPTDEESPESTEKRQPTPDHKENKRSEQSNLTFSDDDVVEFNADEESRPKPTLEPSRSDPEDQYEAAPDQPDPELPLVISKFSDGMLPEELTLPEELIACDTHAPKCSHIPVLLDDTQYDVISNKLERLMGGEQSDNIIKLKIEKEDPLPPGMYVNKEGCVSSKELDEYLQENHYTNTLRTKHYRPKIKKVDAQVQDHGEFVSFRIKLIGYYLNSCEKPLSQM
ncbi:DNA ligase 1-like isoform X2 [Cloeon dipterum]